MSFNLIFFHFIDDYANKKVIFFFSSSISFLLSSFRVTKSIDGVLHLSKIFGLPASEPGVFVVEFIFSMAWQLLDASLDDEGLLNLTLEQNSKWLTKPQDMEIDGHDGYDEKWSEHNELLKNANTVMAIEIIGEMLQNIVTSRILFLARQHMYEFVLFIKFYVSFCQALDMKSSFCISFLTSSWMVDIA